MQSGVRTAMGRLALVAGGLATGLVLIECGLRLLAAVAPLTLTRSRPAATDPGVQLLCIGDSHTYGVKVPPDRSYPEQLERALRARGVPATVYNLGLPGQSTRQVLDRLPQQLGVYRPDVVLLWAGINDYWNLRGREDDPDAARWRFGWNELRLVRFAHLFREGLLTERAFENRRPNARIDEPGDDYRDVYRWRVEGPGAEEVVEMPRRRGNLDPSTVERLLRDDVVAIVRLVRAHGATPVLFVYPFPLQENVIVVNRGLRGVASAEGVAVVDTGVVVHRLSQRGYHNLAFPDLHPTAVLYRSVAWEAARHLVRERIVSESGGSAPRP